MGKLSRDFYNRDAREVANNLIGKVLVCNYEGKTLKARISETEAYIAAIDKASHGYGGKITERTKVMFGPPGFTYVYFIYGMYYCLNVVTDGVGICSAVLIRGVIPIENIEEMCLNRYGKPFKELDKKKLQNITNGPGKLCLALKIDKNDNNLDLLEDRIYIEDDGYKNFSIQNSKRINIDYAEEAKDFLWRYSIKY